MKKQRFVFIAFLALTALSCFFIIFTLLLRKQNDQLTNNIKRIDESIAVLQSRDTTKEIIGLKTQNSELKRQVIALQSQLAGIPNGFGNEDL
jgi:flagellar capping protein FliD